MLALLLLSFAGPWDIRSDGSREHLYNLIKDLLAPHPFSAPALFLPIFAALVVLPVTCLAAAVAPQSRSAVPIYRVWLGATTADFGLLIGLTALSPDKPTSRYFFDLWGPLLYFVALLLALIVEVTSFLRRRKKAA